MSNFYAYDGTTWRDITEPWAYDGATWREITEAWSYDGAVWRKVFEASGCGTATCDALASAWVDVGNFGGNCGSNCLLGRCTLCIAIDWTDCVDSCNNMDGYVSTNGGSYLLSASCSNKTCGNAQGCQCDLEFDCNLVLCKSNSSTYQGRVIIQLTSDSSTVCTLTEASSNTGGCLGA